MWAVPIGLLYRIPYSFQHLSLSLPASSITYHTASLFTPACDIRHSMKYTYLTSMFNTSSTSICTSSTGSASDLSSKSTSRHMGDLFEKIVESGRGRLSPCFTPEVDGMVAFAFPTLVETFMSVYIFMITVTSGTALVT
jgi:hypothetical protein